MMMPSEKSKGHVRFTFSDYNQAWYEVVKFDGDREVYWASVDCVLDCRTGVRCGLRPAPYDVAIGVTGGHGTQKILAL